jgi:hypothetical protein
MFPHILACYPFSDPLDPYVVLLRPAEQRQDMDIGYNRLETVAQDIYSRFDWRFDCRLTC